MTGALSMVYGMIAYVLLGAVIGLWFVVARIGRTAQLRGLRSLPLCALILAATIVLWPLVIVREWRGRSFAEFEA